MRDAIIRVAADGSAGSRRALEWAIDEATLRGGAVELVCVYSLAHGEGVRSKADAEAAIHATMDDIVAGRADVPLVSWHVVAGDPADVLTRESEHSDLLAMGSHGLERLRHSARSSVADICTRTAACPVVVIPPPHRVDHRIDGVQIGVES
jgi:nucleotide-binding universal stress UspA family protein